MVQSSVKVRFYNYAIAILPLIILLGTGVLMLYYHTGAPKESVLLGQNGYFWLSFHKVISVICTPLILLHLLYRTNWVKNFFLFRLKGKFKTSNIVLFVSFLLCLFTSIGSWLIFRDTDIAAQLKGVHNKVGIILIIVFCLHVWNYRRLIINQLKKLGKST